MTAEHTIQGDVTSLGQLTDRRGRYLADTVDVTGSVSLVGLGLERLPVQFGSVGGDFYCHENRLTSLEGAPSTVGGSFSCAWNRLTSLQGAPSTVVGSFYCGVNCLTSLAGVHRILRRIAGGLHIWNNPIETGGIGLILVEGLTRISTEQPLIGIVEHPAFKIINRHLGQGMRGLLRCQEALHDAGHEAFAQL